MTSQPPNHAPPTSVAAVLFDVVETLFSLDHVRVRLDAAGAGTGALELWFARFLRDGFALASSGSFAPFREVAAASLAGTLRLRGLDATPARVDEVLEGLTELDPHVDARPALELVRERGVRLATLSNGGVESTRRLLTRAGLSDLVDVTLSAEQFGIWKPRAEPYLGACRRLGVEPGRAALVAVHSWDTQGAARAGLQTGWCSRLEHEYPRVFAAPTVRGATLLDVVDQLL